MIEEAGRPEESPMKRILLVEDDPDIVGSLAMLLAEKYEVAVAADGEAARRRVAAGPFDLILMDLIMPVVDGEGLVRALRMKKDKTPLLIMSAVANLLDRAKALNIDQYIEKPFHIDDLEVRIEGMIHPSRPAGG